MKKITIALLAVFFMGIANVHAQTETVVAVEEVTTELSAEDQFTANCPDWGTDKCSYTKNEEGKIVCKKTGKECSAEDLKNCCKAKKKGYSKSKASCSKTGKKGCKKSKSSCSKSKDGSFNFDKSNNYGEEKSSCSKKARKGCSKSKASCSKSEKKKGCCKKGGEKKSCSKSVTEEVTPTNK